MKRMLPILSCAALLVFLAGCSKSGPKSDAELHLNAQQSAGRRIFQADCASCHHAYSSAGSQGPSLKGLFQKKFLPSGLPTNDRFVVNTISGGRGMMPGFGNALSNQQVEDLLAYLHTL